MFNAFPRFFTGIEDRDEHIRKLCISGAYFALTFILTSYTAHAWSASNAWDLGHRPLFNYDSMDNLMGTSGWTSNRIAWVYVMPALWGLVLTAIGLISFRILDAKTTHLRTFMFWLSINGFLLYFSYIITGIMSGQDYSSTLFTGFVSYYAWVKLGRAEIYGLLSIQAIFSLPIALIYSKPVLQLNFSRLLAAKNNGKPVIFIHVILVPFLIGTALIILATFPMDLGYQSIRLFSFLPVFIVILLGLGLHKAKHITIVKGGLKPVSLAVVIVVFVSILLSRFLLQVSIPPLW